MPNKRINPTRQGLLPLRGVTYWRAGYAQHVGQTPNQRTGAILNAHSRLRLALLLWVLGIVVASLIPSTGVSFWNLDKVGHFLAYAGLATLICLSFEGTKARLGALIGAVVLGALLEVAQSFVPGRDMSLLDATTNTLGVLSGAVLFRLRGSEMRRWATTIVGVRSR